MDEIFSRIVENLAGRIDGPMKFRLLLQPTMAIFFAIRDGKRDALEGSVPYFWAIFTQPAHRTELLREGWKSVTKVFCAALLIDLIYQLMVLRWFYPGEALIVALTLAFLPYLLIRGPVNRLFAGKRQPSVGENRARLTTHDH